MYLSEVHGRVLTEGRRVLTEGRKAIPPLADSRWLYIHASCSCAELTDFHHNRGINDTREEALTLHTR